MNEEVQKLIAGGKINPSDGAKLSQLEPGTFCFHKSWGVGRVSEWDLFADRITIDFEGKPGHSMKVGFAVSSLEVLPPDHFLSKSLTEPDEMKKLAKENPAALVEMALRSGGGKMSLDQLDSMIKGRLVPEADYKKWWEAAKRALKPVRHIVVPSKRSDPLVLRESEEQAGKDLVQAFLSARDLKGKLAALKSIAADLSLVTDPSQALVPVFQDLTDTVRRSARLQLKEGLQLILSRDELIESGNLGSAPMGSIKVEDLLSEFRETIAEATKGLPAGLMGRVYRAFPSAYPDGAWVTECLNHLTRTGGRAVIEIATVLHENGEQEVLTGFLKKAVRNRRLSSDLLIWICRERTGLASPVFDVDLGNAILDALQSDHLEGGPKRTGRLLDAFTNDPDLLGNMAATADEQELRLFAKRILNAPVFEELTRRSLMAKIIKARPELSNLVTNLGGSKQDDALIVSWESLERRKSELEDLVQVKIPQNKKDIQIAREYGDLRENFEYKSAKQQQAVLQRMQGELERDLNRAQGSDFLNVSTDTVGVGTVVVVEDIPSGDLETFTILGAWDGDVEKNIISYLSETAKVLIGKSEGAEVALPSDDQHGTRKARIQSIKAFRTS